MAGVAAHHRLIVWEGIMQHRTGLWAALLLGLSAALGGCVTHPAGPAEVYVPPHGQATGFQGVIANAPPAKARYVFITHGMGKTEDTFADRLLDWLVDAGYERTSRQRAATADGWIPVTLAEPYDVSGGALICGPGGDHTRPPCRFASFGGYKIDSFRHGRSGDVVHVYRFFWQASLQAVQDPFIANDNDVPRATLNGALKVAIVNYGFADAAGYIGPMGVLMREGAEGAVCSMMRDASAGGPDVGARRTDPCAFADLDPGAIPNDVSLNFISQSLGSRLMMDTLASAYEPQGNALVANVGGIRTRAVQMTILHQTSAFYMLANQLPLLGIGCVEIHRQGAPPPGDQPCRISRFADAVADARRAGPAPGKALAWLETPPLEVVSFQDPDDLLGFRFSDDFPPPGSKTLKAVQVLHRNTPQRRLLQYTFADPSAAHATELDHLSSARLILCGGALQSDGKTLAPAADCLPKPQPHAQRDWQ